MRVVTEEPLNDYIVRFPDIKTALQSWLKTVKKRNGATLQTLRRTSIALTMLVTNTMYSIYVEIIIGL